MRLPARKLGVVIGDGTARSTPVWPVPRRDAEFGVITGAVSVDYAAAMQRMLDRVDQSRAGLESWPGGLNGLTIIDRRELLAADGS